MLTAFARCCSAAGRPTRFGSTSRAMSRRPPAFLAVTVPPPSAATATPNITGRRRRDLVGSGAPGEPIMSRALPVVAVGPVRPGAAPEPGSALVPVDRAAVRRPSRGLQGTEGGGADERGCRYQDLG